MPALPQPTGIADHEYEVRKVPTGSSRLAAPLGRWALVGWAKAPLRRAHHLLSGSLLQMVGTLSLCPPYGRWTKRQSGQGLKIAVITH